MIAKTFIFFPILFLVGCGGRGGDDNAELEVAKPVSQVVGEVSSVHREQGFILFRNQRGHEFTDGGTLSARSVDGIRIVPLDLNPESLGRYNAATFPQDQEGPRVGDIVVLSALGAEPETVEAPEIMTQKQKIN